LNGGVGEGVGFTTGGGPVSTQPSRAGIVEGRRGPNAIHPKPATMTSALPTTRALTSAGSAAKRRHPREPAVARGAGPRSGAAAAASSSALARDIPQWHASARRGTRRPQVGHAQECDDVSATAAIVEQVAPARAVSPRTPDPPDSPANLMQNAAMGVPAFEELGHGITAIDTGYVRPSFDASHLVVENGRAAFVDVGTFYSVPGLLAVLEAKGLPLDSVEHVIVTHVHLDHAGGAGEMMRRLPKARLVVHPRGARHMVDPSRLWAGAAAVYGEEAMARNYGDLVPVDPSRIVEAPEGFTLELAGRPLVFLDTPGHARHHFCVWDEASRSMFTGDTFGLSYRELESQRGAFIMPTTTPVQFEPEALLESIDRLLGYLPVAMILTHYSRVTEIGRLAGDLRRRIEELVALGRAQDGKRDRGGRLRAGVEELCLGWARDHGAPLTQERVRDLLAVDVELNAQGLEAWLDRDRRVVP
jgi:glyoxylase-like metal-dependent hydrolase (beta-lactamase superfamily II)